MGLPVFSSEDKQTPQQEKEQQQQQATPSTGATGAGANTGAGVTRPKTEEEKEADRLYEEAMEEDCPKEYAMGVKGQVLFNGLPQFVVVLLYGRQLTRLIPDLSAEKGRG
ncbi:hypothetical protein B0T10DRAFT_607511 [Thelonectria olida]|uniref:Uncharacterized protein n=1 Tax=Thelonectria olida TaxID=1576542 RepID=A0A9P8W4H8_9HYPO|nr:hypothetical protein B0T10DRAFT_607511 [Thelonectria olida]